MVSSDTGKTISRGKDTKHTNQWTLSKNCWTKLDKKGNQPQMLFVYHEEVGGASVVVVGLCPGHWDCVLRYGRNHLKGKTNLISATEVHLGIDADPFAGSRNNMWSAYLFILKSANSAECKTKFSVDQTIEIGGLQQTQIHLYKCPVRWWNRTL